MTENEHRRYRAEEIIAIEKAIANKRLSISPLEKTYTGDYVYIFTDSKGKDQFRHRTTWKRLP